MPSGKEVEMWVGFFQRRDRAGEGTGLKGRFPCGKGNDPFGVRGVVASGGLTGPFKGTLEAQCMEPGAETFNASQSVKF
jgi:hypothetical protein